MIKSGVIPAMSLGNPNGNCMEGGKEQAILLLGTRFSGSEQVADVTSSMLLQRGQKKVISYLLNLAGSSLAMKHIPKNWRKAIVTFILKIGKEDPISPISLTSFLLKAIKSE